MKKDFPYLSVVSYGAGHWFTVLAISFLLFSFRQNEPIFFESLISLTLVAVTIFFGFIFLRRYRPISSKEALLTGFVWMLVNLALDQLLFMWGPMKMNLIAYVKDIGVTYLMVPAIIWAMEYYHESVVRKEKSEKK
ncbi:MAG: hypothetical protein QY314_03385 [Candidatus Dojkabacteria bacterium]|nr:MAG: hypothetical protein QY314_03385 [Candidatus Dojkabacteria bacterium]